MNDIELLSPAGSAQSLIAAVQSGADAVYTGGRLFSARQGADNFSFKDLCEYVRYCHFYGVKVHVAVNTLIKEKEISQLAEYIKELAEAGVDALIVQDMGAVSVINQVAPDMEMHASTQMTVTNLDGVLFLQDNGFSRVVLARELSKKNIEYIIKNSDAEIEIFAHGALCICYSGQCLMSSIIGGRSGNRGRCAQPCRLPYSLLENGKKVRSGYLLSPKDLCLVDRLNDIKNIGVSSIKIEGRLKRPEYVAAVTGVYRKYIDSGKPVAKDDMEELLNAFNRSGFTQAYFSGKTGSSMMSTEKPGNDSSNIFTNEVKQRSKIDANVRKIAVNMFCELRIGKPLSLTVWDNDGNCISEKGTQKSEMAENKPLTDERIRQQLMKTGSTPFAVSECTVDADEDATVPISEVNNVRRSALDMLYNMRAVPKQHKVCEFVLKEQIKREKRDTKIYAEVHTVEQLKAALDSGLDGVYVPLDLYKQADTIKTGDTKIILKLPEVIRDDFNYEYPDTDDIMITHFGQIKHFEGKNLYGDFRLNVYNSYTADFYSDLSQITLSPELNIYEMKELLKYTDVNAEVIAYGRLPLMITQNCPSKQYKCSAHKQMYALSDRRGEKFPLICGVGCYAKIINSKPIFMADKFEDIKNLQINSIRLLFTVENYSECDKIISVYKSAAAGETVKNCFGEGEYTRGHFYRGVQ